MWTKEGENSTKWEGCLVNLPRLRGIIDGFRDLKKTPNTNTCFCYSHDADTYQTQRRQTTPIKSWRLFKSECIAPL